MTFVMGPKRVADLMDRTVRPTRWDDTSWFRSLTTLAAEPFAVVHDDVMLFGWIRDSIMEFWGQLFIDVCWWTPGHRSIGASRLLEIVREPVTLRDLCVSFRGIPEQLHHPLCTEIDDVVTVLRVRWKSLDEFRMDVWSHKRRYNVERELRPYRGFRIDVANEIEFSTYAWLVDKSVPAAQRGGEPSLFICPLPRASYWNLLVGLAKVGGLRVLKIFDGDKLVAVSVFHVDSLENSITLHFSHADAAYSSLGKMLYEWLVDFAIRGSIKEIWGGFGLLEIKKLFRFEPVRVWTLEDE